MKRFINWLLDCLVPGRRARRLKKLGRVIDWKQPKQERVIVMRMAKPAYERLKAMRRAA